ncbi:hypothetical protein ACP275_14G030500 [Erythranthe tilingii]
MASDQQLNSLQDFQEEESICRSMLHLSTAADHHHPTTSIPHNAATFDSPDKYSATTYTNSAKRHSPLFPSSFYEPASKRATLRPPPHSSTTADDTRHLLGFTKLPLPHSFPTAAPPSPLRRTLSEPIQLTEPTNSEAPPPQFSELPPVPNHQPPPQESSFPYPNPQPFIYRTVSDPSPVLNCQVAAAAAAATPPRPNQSRHVSRSPSCGESPSQKRLKRMKERMREMSQWWNEVVLEGEDEDDEPENYIHKEECESETENPKQEAVWVEKNGDCLVLHFKCPCGNGYQILLSGNNCYYKLTNF